MKIVFKDLKKSSEYSRWSFMLSELAYEFATSDKFQDERMRDWLLREWNIRLTYDANDDRSINGLELDKKTYTMLLLRFTDLL